MERTRTTMLVRLVKDLAELSILLLMLEVQHATARCGDPPNIFTLVEGSFGREVVIRATLLQQTKNSSCPLSVYRGQYSSYVESNEGFGALQVEEVFRGNTTFVGDQLTFLYWTDTGYRQELPTYLADAAMSTEGILVFLSRPSLACADNNTNYDDSIFSISECDFGNGIPYEGGWANVSSEDQKFLRSLNGSNASNGSTTPAAQPTISTLTPTSLPTSYAIVETNSVWIASLIWVTFILVCS